MQKRMAGLLRDTWWLWSLFFVINCVMAIRISTVFLVMFPILTVAFVYYAAMRYDDNGNHKVDEQT